MTAKIGGDIREDRIEALLDVFDGDPIAAVHAIRDYVQTRRQPTHQPSGPKGPVLLTVKEIAKTYKLGRQRVEVLRGISGPPGGD